MYDSGKGKKRLCSEGRVIFIRKLVPTKGSEKNKTNYFIIWNMGEPKQHLGNLDCWTIQIRNAATWQDYKKLPKVHFFTVCIFSEKL
jgi:hypothetical protein